MNKNVARKAQMYSKTGRRRRLRMRILTFLCAVVVFITTYMLILPAITMEPEVPFCGYVEHEHGESCYETIAEDASLTLICSPDVHTHKEECYSENELICGEADFIIHTHSDLCYYNEMLICTLEEAEEHTHTEECFEAQDKLICEETDEAHVHSGECYESITAFICEKKEAVLHSHGDGCYLIKCESADCTESPCIDETHEKTKTLICERTVVKEHTHTEKCLSVPENKKVLSCETEEHTHTLICYSDKTADIERETEWKNSFAAADLSGPFAADILEIAKTQLGYSESLVNYTVAEDGTSKQGITRYGQWLGTPYADWNAIFVSFCANQALEGSLPRTASVSELISYACDEGIDAYKDAGAYEPSAGDLAFRDTDGDGYGDRVGIVSEYDKEAGSVKVIEGDYGLCVASATFSLSEKKITGFMQLTSGDVLASVDTEGTVMYLAPEHTAYQYSSHTVGGFTALNYVLIPYDEYTDTWSPATLDWNANAEANYTVAYSASSTDVSEGGATYTSQLIKSSPYSDRASVLSGIIAHSYPYITAEKMRAELKAAYENGEIATDLSCCKESDFIAAVQWAIWDTAGSADSIAEALGAAFPDSNGSSLHPLTDPGHTSEAETNSHVKAIRDWLLTKRAPEMLSVAEHSLEIKKNFFNTFDTSVTIKLSRPLGDSERITAVFRAGSKTHEIVYTAEGGDTLEISLNSLSEAELLSASVTLTVYADGMQVYVHRGAEQDMISGQEETTVYSLSPELEVETTSVDVTKVWADEDNREESITVQLYADGEKYLEPVALSDENGWSHVWSDLIRYSEGNTPIEYTVKEVLLPEFLSTIEKADRDGGTVFTITNTRADEITSVTVNNEWKGRSDGKYPENLTVMLYQNGSPYGDSITLNEENGWSYTWEALPRRVGDRYFEYTVSEMLPDNYTRSITKEAGDGGSAVFNIVNTWKQTYISLKLLKTDSTDTDLLLSGAQLRLYYVADGDEGDSQVIPLSGGKRGYLVKNAFTDENGELFIGDIEVGRTYYLIESKAPDGYAKLKAPIIFKAETGADGTPTVTVIANEESILLTEDEGSSVIRIKNPKAYLLPETGGTGNLVYISGGAVLLASLILLFYIALKRRRERENTS